MADLLGLILTMAGGLIIGYAILLLLLWMYMRRHPAKFYFKEALRLIPDIIVLLWRLLLSPDTGVWVKIPLAALLAYLAWPFDLVPDFIPVLGIVDDVVVVTLVLQLVVRKAGYAVIKDNWPGNETGLELVRRLVNG